MSRATTSQVFAKSTAQAGVACVCFNVRKTARVMTQLYDDMLRPTGLRVTQFSLLMGTRSLEPVTLLRLAKVMAMDRTTLTRNLRPLEQQKLLQIVPGEDRRERCVTLTPRGHQVLVEAFPLWDKAQAQVMDAFGRERLSLLVTELAGLRTVSRQRRQ